ncbi:GspH/FimT family pseudopilin [Stenotrophomonas indicatrix]|uniref:GspH/FimT family pseudopilin n=1 Tax=Stenotrophomonas indicatrix TaxID=2045451 RepID=UPI0008D2EC6F|nr:GspH/FimT family pseudopilin [Stenotrophomonas indicatrix]SES88310.1 type IV fimbrial biogenesis protein FimT [Stenotrophomonas indicatrix]
MQTSRLRGHTLTEIMVVVAILAVLAGLAFAPASAMLDRLRTDQLRLQLHGALNLARSTALDRRQAVVACPSDDGRTCGDNWGRGWLLLPERWRRAEAPALEPIAARVLDSHHSLSAFASHGRPQVVFRANGRSAGSNTRIVICQHGQMRAEVVVSNTGRVRSLRSTAQAPC